MKDEFAGLPVKLLKRWLKLAPGNCSIKTGSAERPQVLPGVAPFKTTHEIDAALNYSSILLTRKLFLISAPDGK